MMATMHLYLFYGARAKQHIDKPKQEPSLWRGSRTLIQHKKRNTHNTGGCNQHSRFLFSNGSIERRANSNGSAKKRGDVRLMGERGEAGGVQYVLLGGEK